MHNLYKLINSIHFHKARVFNRLYLKNNDFSVVTKKHQQLIISDKLNISTIGLTKSRFGNVLLNDKYQKCVLGLNNNKNLLTDPKLADNIISIPRYKGFMILNDLYLSWYLTGYVCFFDNSIIPKEGNWRLGKDIIIFNKNRAEKFFYENINSHTRNNQHLQEQDVEFKNHMIDMFSEAKNDKILNFLINNNLPVTNEMVDLFEEINYLNNLTTFNTNDIEKFLHKFNIKENLTQEIFKE